VRLPAASTTDAADVAVAAVFQAFCDALGLTSVAVVGYSAGTPFATALGCCREGLVSRWG
jgi:hypothetical protein